MTLIQTIELLPREQLKKSGVSSLNDSALVALLLGSGTKSKNVFQLAEEILQVIDSMWPHVSFEVLEKCHGIGQAKATLLIAALEFARRRIKPCGIAIRAAKDVLPHVQHYGDRKQEHFIVLSLNGAHEVIACRVVTIGLVNRTQVHPREVFSDALMDRASAIIVAHNHPSNNLSPSDEDIQVTNNLVEAGKILGIKVLDHIIFGSSGFYSLKEEGRM